jgi:hypothetical protein
MAHLDTKIETIGKRKLELMLPKTSTIAIASPAVGRYEQVIGIGVFGRTNCLPPAADGSHGKFGGVTACAHVDESFIAANIIDAVRDGYPLAIGGKIMVKYRNWLFAPLATWLMKRSDKFPALGIHTDYWQPIGGIIFYLGANLAKLLITLTGARWISQPGLKAFQVSAQRIIHFLKQFAHRAGRNANTHTFELSGDLAGGFAGPCPK